MSLTLTLVAAVAIGLLLGLLGGGGSILTLPVLVYLAGQEPKSAIAMSLFVVAATSAVALIPHARAGRVQWRIGLTFGTAGLIGAYAGGRAADVLPPTALLLAFALMMAVAATMMIRSCRHQPQLGPRVRQPAALLALGTLIGTVTGLVGAGGGFVIVPALVLIAGLPMGAAVGTSLLVIAMQATTGLIGHLHSTAIDWPLALAVTAIAIVGSLIGAGLAAFVPPRLLRTAFGWFLATMAGAVLLEQLPNGIREVATGTAAGRIVVIAACAGLVVAATRHITGCRTSQTMPGEQADQARAARALV